MTRIEVVFLVCDVVLALLALRWLFGAAVRVMALWSMRVMRERGLCMEPGCRRRTDLFVMQAPTIPDERATVYCVDHLSKRIGTKALLEWACQNGYVREWKGNRSDNQ